MNKPETGIEMLSKTGKESKHTENDHSFGKIKKTYSTYSDSKLQQYLLEEVSRTFALTIPALPEDLSPVVSNAYLLCRIIDTIEDEPELSASQKREFSDRFIDVITCKEEAEDFSKELSNLLSDETLPGEIELITLTDRVVNITHSFDKSQKKALERCVRKMADGMIYYQENASVDGLQNLEAMNNYCYYVAGVVGEMLTELFCHYSPEIAENRSEMMNLAVSFGQGLQMTNILKDVWEDYERSACWLPRDHFSNGLDNLSEGKSTSDFKEGMQKLSAIAHAHLQDAMEYTLLIPAKEKGIRRFCYWAIGMAVLTLQKIYRNPDFTNGNQVKISRRSVKTTVFLTNLTVHSNVLLKMLFNITRWGLPSHKT